MAQNLLDLRFSHFVAPPPTTPISNDQSLGILLVNIGQLESLVVYVTIHCPPSRHLRGTGA